MMHYSYDCDSYLEDIHASGLVNTGISEVFVLELLTDPNTPGKVYMRKKARMGKHVPWSEKTLFYPHAESKQPQTMPAKGSRPIMADFKQ